MEPAIEAKVSVSCRAGLFQMGTPLAVRLP